MLKWKRTRSEQELLEKPLTCGEAAPFLTLLFDREASDLQETIARRHLTVCRECETRFRSWKELGNLLRQEELRPPPPGMLWRILTVCRLLQTQKRPQRGAAAVSEAQPAAACSPHSVPPAGLKEQILAATLAQEGGHTALLAAAPSRPRRAMRWFSMPATLVPALAAFLLMVNVPQIPQLSSGPVTRSVVLESPQAPAQAPRLRAASVPARGALSAAASRAQQDAESEVLADEFHAVMIREPEPANEVGQARAAAERSVEREDRQSRAGQVSVELREARLQTPRGPEAQGAAVSEKAIAVTLATAPQAAPAAAVATTPPLAMPTVPARLTVEETDLRPSQVSFKPVKASRSTANTTRVSGMRVSLPTSPSPSLVAVAAVVSRPAAPAASAPVLLARNLPETADTDDIADPKFAEARSALNDYRALFASDTRFDDEG